MSNSEVSKHFSDGKNMVQNEKNSSIVGNNESTKTGRNTPVPTELLAEFLSSVMTKDYEKALNLCTRLLNYEPDNSTALEFYPLILEKLEMKLEDNSSESSDTYSSTSSSSGKSLFHSNSLRRISSSGTIKSNPISECDKTNEFCESNLIPLERKLKTRNTVITKPHTSNQTQKSKLKPSTKTNLKKKSIQNDAPTPSNAKTQPKEKNPSKSDNALNSVVKATGKTKQENQKAQKKSVNSQQPPKVLLHMTKTQTFSKSPPTSKNEKTAKNL